MEEKKRMEKRLVDNARKAITLENTYKLKFVKGDRFNYLRLDLEIYHQLLSIVESIISPRKRQL